MTLSVASHLKEEEATAENGMCCGHRKLKRWDVFYDGQRIFLIVRREDCVVVLVKKFEDTKWEVFEPPVHPESS